MVIVLMGVTGCGKTTVGKILANELGWHFYDADDFHPEENVEKMRQGIPLDDNDRMPWLQALRNLIDRAHDNEFNVVLACSALKEQYRNMLSHELKPVKFIYLRGPESLIDFAKRWLAELIPARGRRARNENGLRESSHGGRSRFPAGIDRAT